MSLQMLEKIIRPIKIKIERVEKHLIFVGIVFTILAFLVAGSDFMVRFLIGAIVLMLAYLCFYVAYRIRGIKKEIFKHFK